MKDPCRICGVRLVGSQCRWIFSSSGKRKLQVILSHVLGWELTRDGRGEFLCGKCVFQLEKVIQCDINVSQLHDEHNIRIQKLQAEKEHLIQCIAHIYNKNNPGLKRSDRERNCKIPLRSSGLSSPDDEVVSQLASEGQQYKEYRGSYVANRMRRCVSLDRIASGGGVLPGCSSLKRLGSAAGLDGSMKNFGLRGTRHRSQSMYLDLVQRKGTLPKSGFKGCSTSMQSLSQDLSTDLPSEPSSKLKFRGTRLAVRRITTDDPGGKAQARALLQSLPSQPSVISDLIQLLRCISRQRVSVPEGSHIPVLNRPATAYLASRTRRRNKEAEWKSLHNLTEEFDDEYTPVKLEVVHFSYPG